MGLFEWYAGLPPLLRFFFALVPLAISTVLFFFFDRLWPWGWAVGGVMLCFSLPSPDERNKWTNF